MKKMIECTGCGKRFPVGSKKCPYCREPYDPSLIPFSPPVSPSPPPLRSGGTGDGDSRHFLRLAPCGEAWTVTGCEPGAPTNLRIPAQVEGKPVREIQRNAFRFCRQLRFIALPDSLLRIGDQAFEGCVSLAEVSGGNGLEALGERAFSGCLSLTLERCSCYRNTVAHPVSAFAGCYQLPLEEGSL